MLRYLQAEEEIVFHGRTDENVAVAAYSWEALFEALHVPEPEPPRVTPEVAEQVWEAAKTTGRTTEFAPCPAGCELAEEHRHYSREPGVYYRLVAPTACCGREWARYDEVLIFDQCAWCCADGKPLPGAILLYPTATPIRDAPRRKRR
jgi:hypothetical protein